MDEDEMVTIPKSEYTDLIDYYIAANCYLTFRKCPHCEKPLVSGYICCHCEKDPYINYDKE